MQVSEEGRERKKEKGKKLGKLPACVFLPASTWHLGRKKPVQEKKKEKEGRRTYSSFASGDLRGGGTEKRRKKKRSAQPVPFSTHLSRLTAVGEGGVQGREKKEGRKKSEREHETPLLPFFFFSSPRCKSVLGRRKKGEGGDYSRSFILCAVCAAIWIRGKKGKGGDYFSVLSPRVTGKGS